MGHVRRCIKHFFDKESTKKYLLLGLSILAVAAITFLQCQASVSSIPFLNTNKMSMFILAWNLFVFTLIVLLLTALFKKTHIAILVWSIFSFLFAIINYYVLLLHGAPLTIHLLKNTATALDVISSYHITLDKYSICIVLGFVACLAIFIFLRFFKKGKLNICSWKKRLVTFGVTLALLFTTVYLGVFSSISFKPKNSIVWSWSYSAGSYGFLPLQLESHFQEKNYLDNYAYYSKDDVVSLYNSISSENTSAEVSDYPDIILILNESFYDLENITDLNSNISPLSNFYATKNALTGYAVVPGDSGGTNRSEYELLTSSSVTLLPNLTPFQAMDVKGQKSIVSYLEAQGYETYGAHPSTKTNYNRAYSYPALGFDHSFFSEDFTDMESYGKRPCTDASAYKNLIRWYEEESAKPKFMYLLTYQNHGSWDQNPAELDTVKVGMDYGANTDQVNEYLSSVQLSDTALVELLSYFETVDRPVIVCMVGDHAPSFAKTLSNISVSDEEFKYQIRSTPLMIWSNYGLQSRDLGRISLNYVIPTLLDAAGLPLSPFYRYQLDIMKEVPVITAFDTFYDTNMVESRLDVDSELSFKARNYLNMCYNNFLDNRFNYLFEPMK